MKFRTVHVVCCVALLAACTPATNPVASAPKATTTISAAADAPVAPDPRPARVRPQAPTTAAPVPAPKPAPTPGPAPGPAPKPAPAPAPKPVPAGPASLTNLTCTVTGPNTFRLSFTLNRPPLPPVRTTNYNGYGEMWIGTMTYNGVDYWVDKTFNRECGL